MRRSFAALCLWAWGGCAPGGILARRAGTIVKGTAFGSFQLESLILAQNERWRQA